MNHLFPDPGPQRLPPDPLESRDLVLPPVHPLLLNPPRRIFISGTTHSGKTTLVEALHRHTGVRGVPEPARSVQRRLERGEGSSRATVTGSGGENRFSEIVLKRRLELEAKLRPERSYFLDRGLLDNLAYYRVGGACTKAFDSLRLPGRYDLVFILEIVPGIQADGFLNSFDVQAQQRIQDEIRHAYLEHRYQPITLPLCPVHERVERVVQEVERHWL
jgi:predicted ATPase